MKNKNHVMWGIILAASLLQLSVFAEGQKQPPKEETPAHLRKPMANPTDNPDLPNVLIIGDSISIGYTVAVRNLLNGKADVFRVMANCAHSGSGVKSVEKWVANRKWDVIHFNFGIWDTHYMHNGKLVRKPSDYAGKKLTLRYTTDQYIDNLTDILAVLKTTDSTLIWASTTPIAKTRWKEKQQAAHLEKKKAAEELMKKEGVIINDLYTLALPHLDKWQSTDGCHFNMNGYNQLAEQVASSISDALRMKKKQPTNE